MSTLTEGTRIGDVLNREDPNLSREVLTVLSGQSIVIGEACEIDSNGKVVESSAAAGAVDEVQTITPSVGGAANEVQTITPSVGANADAVQVITTTGTQTGGTFKLGVRPSGDPLGGIRWTDTIAWSATEATQTASAQAALDNLLGANEIVVSTIATTVTMVLELTFSGTLSTNRVQGAVGIDVSALTGADNVTSIVTTTEGSGTITSGSYRIRVTDADGDSQVTPPIAWDGNAAAINTALDDALGAVGAVATGGPMSTPAAVILTFSGVGFASTPQPMVTLEFDRLVGCDDVSIVETTPGGGAIRVDGTYRIGITDFNGNMQWTNPIAADGNAAAIIVALDDALGVAGVVATGGPMSGPTAIVLTYSGVGYTGVAFALAVIDISNLQGVDDVSIVETTAGSVVSGAGSDVQVVALEDIDASLGDVEGAFAARNTIIDAAFLTIANSGVLATAAASLAKVNPITGFGRNIVRSGPTYTTLQ